MNSLKNGSQTGRFFIGIKNCFPILYLKGKFSSYRFQLERTHMPPSFHKLP